MNNKGEAQKAYQLLIVRRSTDTLDGFLLAIFRRACLDCLHGDRELAVDALQFLSSAHAAEYTLCLGLPANAIGDLAHRYLVLAQARFDDFEIKEADLPSVKEE